MEFLLIWVLGGDVIDSGLRYKSAAKCFSESQNAATEMSVTFAAFSELLSKVIDS